MKTLKLRIKDKHCKVLNQMASEVNFVWNYVNDLCFKHLQRKQQFFSAYDIAKYTEGTSKECNLHSQTVQAITEELITLFDYASYILLMCLSYISLHHKPKRIVLYVVDA